MPPADVSPVLQETSSRSKHHSGLRASDRLNSPSASPAFPVIQPVASHGLIRVGIVTYIVALLLIAAFSIACHTITDNIIHEQQATASIVNISGRQRMLSQRIARLSLERASHASFRSDEATQTALRAAISLMDSSHRTLLHDAIAARASAPLIAAVYTQAPSSLDARVQDFLAHAHALAERPFSALTMADPDLAAVEVAAQEPLLAALHAAVVADETTAEAAIKHLRKVLAILTASMLCILLAEALFLYRPLFRRLDHAHTELLELGRTDPLTGCLNRRAFTQEAHRILAAALPAGEPIAVLMVDIDRFKAINDRFGHPFGDQVINTVVDTLLRGTRQGNLVCRMGGEEFAIMLRQSSLAGAATAAERLRAAIASVSVPPELEDEPEFNVTVSIGVASLSPCDTSIFTVLSRADRALYRAKQEGRNRVEVQDFSPDIFPEEAVLAT